MQEAQRRQELAHASTSHHQEKQKIAFGSTTERDLAYLGVPKKYAALNVPLKWVIDLSIDWLFDWVERLIGWLVDWLIELRDWLSNLLIDW